MANHDLYFVALFLFEGGPEAAETGTSRLAVLPRLGGRTESAGLRVACAGVKRGMRSS